MSLGKIIILISLCIGLFLLKKTKPRALQMLVVGFAVSIALSFLDRFWNTDFSFLSFGILVFIYLFYAISNKKWIPILISGLVLVSFVFKANSWPYALEIQLSMIVPVILFLIARFNLRTFKNEISILGILAAYAISEVIRFSNFMLATNS